MAGISDTEMENLLSLADELTDDFQTGITELQTLKSNLSSETQTRQSLELKCSTLTRENDRLKNLHLQTLTNLSIHLQQRENPHEVREQLRKLTEESVRKDEDHVRVIESMKRDHNERVRVLESRIEEVLREKGVDEATICQLHREVVMLRRRVEELEVRYQGEVDDLRDCICAEQEEKMELSRKVRGLEKELLVARTSVAEKQKVSCSDKQLDVMKQKMMKLRRENEVLKRQLEDSKDR